MTNSNSVRRKKGAGSIVGVRNKYRAEIRLFHNLKIQWANRIFFLRKRKFKLFRRESLCYDESKKTKYAVSKGGSST